jgi:hypothetical protein
MYMMMMSRLHASRLATHSTERWMLRNAQMTTALQKELRDARSALKANAKWQKEKRLEAAEDVAFWKRVGQNALMEERGLHQAVGSDWMKLAAAEQLLAASRRCAGHACLP